MSDGTVPIMQNVLHDTPPSMRERLDQAGLARVAGIGTIPLRTLEAIVPEIRDAILTELETPSEGMKRQMFLTKYMDKGPVVMWQAMIQHIKDGGQ